MITVKLSIIAHPYDYELELLCLPAKGDSFMFRIDEDDDDFTYTIVEKIEHFHSDDDGHEIWITLRSNEDEIK